MTTANTTKSEVVFDTNILLTGFLVPPSPSAKAIRLVTSNQIIGIVSESTLEEADEVLARKLPPDMKRYREYFSGFVHGCGFRIEPAVDRGAIDAVDDKVNNFYDRAVIATAVNLNASICSNDIKDINAGTSGGLICQTAEQLTDTGEFTAAAIFKAILLKKHCGCVAYRFHLHIGREDFVGKEPVTSGLLRIENFCQIDLITGDNKIVFRLDVGPEATLEINDIFTAEQSPFTLFASYDNSRGIYLSIADCNGNILSLDTEYVWDSPIAPPRSWSVRPFHQSRYPGDFNYCVGFPKPLNPTEVGNLLSGKTSDNPLERLSVQEMIEFNWASQTP